MYATYPDPCHINYITSLEMICCDIMRKCDMIIYNSTGWYEHETIGFDGFLNWN